MSVFCTVKITLNVIMHRGCKGLIWIQNEWYTYRGGDYLFFFFFVITVSSFVYLMLIRCEYVSFYHHAWKREIVDKSSHVFLLFYCLQ